MKLTYYFLLFCSCLLACKKENSLIPKNTTTTTTTSYSLASVVVGTQTWTSVNYNGIGGISPVSPYNIDAVGKLYTHDEMIKVTPLTGFRIPTRADWEKLIKFLV